MLWLVCDTCSYLITKVKHTCPEPDWIGVQTVVHGFDTRTTPHKPVVSKSYEANIFLSSYDHLTVEGGQRGGC